MNEHASIPGFGADADPKNRPGTPMEHAPRPHPDARVPPTPQQSDVRVFKHGQPARKFPPVYGTAQPPKGLSGALRAVAYKYPDHWTRHWMLLLLADRVDVVESGLRRHLRGASAAAAVLLVGGVTVRLLKRG